jgi:YggT family protein
MLVLLELFHLLLDTAAGLLGSALLLRVYLAWLRLAHHNPLVQFSWALTEWLVRPLRVMIPFRARLDWHCLAAALIVALAFVVLVRVIGFGPALDWSLLVPQALGLLAHWALYMLIVVVAIYALLSIVNPHAPLAPTFELLARPLLAPLRRMLPLVGGWDLSPMAFILIVFVLLTILDTVRL